MNSHILCLAYNTMENRFEKFPLYDTYLPMCIMYIESINDVSKMHESNC